MARIARFSYAVCTVALSFLFTSASLAAGSTMWVPIPDGTTWTFQTSRQWDNSDGNSGSSGPTIEQAHFESVDLQIFDHRATLAHINSGHYLTETPNVIFTISDGDPRDNERYEYYIDPHPFMTKDVLEVGQSVSYSGQWRGQWEKPGGVYEAWTGEWTTTYTNMGEEEVLTPMGTFRAVKFKEVENYTKSPNPNHKTTLTSNRWVVEGVALVKITEHWSGENDFDSDGTSDWWSTGHRSACRS